MKNVRFCGKCLLITISVIQHIICSTADVTKVLVLLDCWERSAKRKACKVEKGKSVLMIQLGLSKKKDVF